MTQPTNPNANQIPETPLYDPVGHQEVAERAYNVATDATTGIVYGDPATGTGGGGGGAVTASAGAYADGAITTIGTEADASATSDSGTFTLIALFKRSLSYLANLVSAKSDLDSLVANEATAANQATANTTLASINTAAGTQADAAYTSGSGSVIAVLKGVFTRLANVVTFAFDSSSRLQISNYAKQTVAGDTALTCDANGSLYVNLINTSGTPTLGAVNLRTNGASVASTNPVYVHDAVGVQVNASTTGAAAASSSATLAGTTSKTTYISGFTVEGDAVTTAASGVVTVTGVNGAPLNYRLVFLPGVKAELNIIFPTPIAATGQNVSIVVSVPAITNGGAYSLMATGYQL